MFGSRVWSDPMIQHLIFIKDVIQYKVQYKAGYGSIESIKIQEWFDREHQDLVEDIKIYDIRQSRQITGLHKKSVQSIKINIGRATCRAWPIKIQYKAFLVCTKQRSPYIKTVAFCNADPCTNVPCSISQVNNSIKKIYYRHLIHGIGTSQDTGFHSSGFQAASVLQNMRGRE